MKRIDENDSPIASDSCTSQSMIGIKFGEPSMAVVLAMLAAGCAELALSCTSGRTSGPNADQILDRNMGLAVDLHLHLHGTLANRACCH